jgi:hypothetical protein
VNVLPGNLPQLRVVTISPQQAPSFLPNPVYVPIPGLYRGAIADLTGDGAPSILRLGWKATTARNGTTLNAILNLGNRQFVLSSAFVVGAPGSQNGDGLLSPVGRIDAEPLGFYQLEMDARIMKGDVELQFLR